MPARRSRNILTSSLIAAGSIFALASIVHPSQKVNLNNSTGNIFDKSNQVLITNNNSNTNFLKKGSGSPLYPIVNPNLVDINGPNVTLVFNKVRARKAFEYLAKVGNYGIVWVESNPISSSASSENTKDERLVTLNLQDVTYTRALNALLLASGLQIKLYSNVFYIGPNVRNTVFTHRSSGVYQLNQITASAAADYLANLGASVTKTNTISTAITSGATPSQSVQGSGSSSTTTSQSTTSVQVYGASIGPLVGLIATTDERLQTITMVGEKYLIKLAKNFLKALDQRQQQVALTVRVLDVNLSDRDSFSNTWATPLNYGSPFVIGKDGLLTINIGQNLPSSGAPVPNPGLAYTSNQNFFSTLTASIEKGATRVLASPTLILSEAARDAGDGSTMGRSKGNEGFVEVGDKVPTNATFAEGTGCSFTYELVGIKLGAKILGIDDNQYVTFSMSPVVTGISSSVNVVGCGAVQLLNTRRVDTGAIRIRDGETLVLTGVIQDTDIEKIYKYPLIGDLPILGSLFRSRAGTSDKRELIVLVTPRIMQENENNLNNFNIDLINKNAKELIQ